MALVPTLHDRLLGSAAAGGSASQRPNPRTPEYKNCKVHHVGRFPVLEDDAAGARAASPAGSGTITLILAPVALVPTLKTLKTRF
jgi:hypothetical protein